MSETNHSLPLGPASSAARYVSWLQQHATACQSEKTADPKAPAISVLMRTQGKRREALKEALLSLEAQSDQDFEVILVVHRATDENKAQTKDLLENLSPNMRGKLSCYFLDSGSRSAPLNLALSVAKGHYVTMLDDDDVVFEDWIENYHKAYQDHDGMVIRCYGMTQFWTVDVDERGNTVLQSSDAPEATYCAPFDLQKQLTDNFTPISCMALPRSCYTRFGIQFDESLNTAEDWDFLMHCSLLCGVYDTKQITFLYRLWLNTENSHTLHRDEEWLQNRAYIMEKLSRIPYVTTGDGSWFSAQETKGAEEGILPDRSFWKRVKTSIRKNGLLRFPIVVMRKILLKIFG